MPDKVSHSHKSVKHEIIDRTNQTMVIAVGIATFIFIFSLFAVKSLISQSLYQNRVISAKEKTLAQIKTDKKTVEELKSSYETFNKSGMNILGGSTDGSGPLDGENAKLILDALPNKYDYPALSSSFEKILKDVGYTIGSIGGKEDSSLASMAPTSGNITPIEIPYSFTVTTDVSGIKRLLSTLERSIRPMYVDTMQIQVGDTIQARVSLHTYFTQEKTFQLGSKEIK